jgi:hypothetical protein
MEYEEGRNLRKEYTDRNEGKEKNKEGGKNSKEMTPEFSEKMPVQ